MPKSISFITFFLFFLFFLLYNFIIIKIIVKKALNEETDNVPIIKFLFLSNSQIQKYVCGINNVGDDVILEIILSVGSSVDELERILVYNS